MQFSTDSLTCRPTEFLELELYRLQHRYTRRRNRTETLSSEAVYVDGEYIYNCPPRDARGKGGVKAKVRRLGAGEARSTAAGR